MAKKSRASKPAPIDPSTIPGVKRASEIPPPPQVDVPIPDETEFTMNTADAVKVLGVSRPSLHRLVESGELMAAREGFGTKKRYMFRPADIDALKAKSKTVPMAGKITAKVGIGAAMEILGSPVDDATNPVIDEVRASNPKLFRGFTDADWMELKSIHGSGGALTAEGVIAEANRINAARKVRERFEVLMHTDCSAELTSFIDYLYEKARFRPKS